MTMRCLRLVTLLAPLLACAHLIAFCPPASGAELPIRGLALTPDGAPVPEARVELMPVASGYQQGLRRLAGTEEPPLATATADASGQYLLAAPGAGVFALRIAAPGRLEVDSGPLPLVAGTDLPPAFLAPDAGARLRVRYPDGRPAAGLWVFARGGSARVRGRGGFQIAPRLGRTAADGTLALPRLEGESLTLHLFPASGAEEVHEGFTGGEIVLGPEPARKLSLRGVDGRGEAVPEVLVRRGEMLWPVALADQEGWAEIPARGREPVRLLLTAADGRRRGVSLAAAGPRPDPVVLAAAGVVSGRVTAAESGSPIAGALVWSAVDPGGFRLTGERGRYRLPAVEEGSWLEARAPDRVPARLRPSKIHVVPSAPLRGDATGSQFNMELERAATVVGRAVDAAGRGVPMAWVQAAVVPGGEGPPAGALTGPEGTFALRPVMPAESYALQARKTGFLPAEGRAVTARPPAQTPVEPLVLLAVRPVVGRVGQPDGLPLAGAEIRVTKARSAEARSLPWARARRPVAEPQAISDPRGHFEIAEILALALDVVVTRPGFARAELRGFQVSPGAGPVDLGTIVLEPGAGIVGRVTDPDERPITGAAIYRVLHLRRPVGELADELRAEEPDAETGADGIFTLSDLSEGSPVHFLVAAPGFLSRTVRGIRPPTPAALVIRLEPGARLLGQVVDEEGRPVPGAGIETTWQPTVPGHDLPAGAPTIRSVTADHEGRFEISDLPAGRLSLAVEASGFRTVEKLDFSLPLPEDEEVIVVLERGATLRGRVTTTEDEPVAGVRVLLDTAAGVSDGDGFFLVEGIEPGSRELEAQHPHYPTLQREILIEEGMNHLDLGLEAGQEVSGWVVDSGGDPVPGAEIRFGLSRGRDVRWYRERTDAEGAFLLAPVAPGSYRLWAGAEGHAPTMLERVVVGDEPIDHLTVLLEPGGIIRGRILGLEPQDLVQVRVRAELRSRDSRPAEVDATGNYRLEDLGPGAWLVQAMLAGGQRQAQARVPLAVGQEAERDLEFEDRLRLTGRVLYREEPLADTVVSLRGRSWAVERWVTTDWEGSFLFEDLEADTYRLGLNNPQQLVVHNQWVELAADRELTIRIDRSDVTGMVVDVTSGSPIAVAQVALRSVVSSEVPEFMVAGGTDDRGAFELSQVPPGLYRLAVTREGYSPLRSELEVPAGQDVTGLELPLEPSPGAELVVRLASGRTPDLLHARVLSPEGLTVVSDTLPVAPDGRVRLTTVPPGSWTLLAATAGGALHQEPLVVPGPTLELTLPGAARVAVRVGELGSSDLMASLRLTAPEGTPLRILGLGGALETDWRMIAGHAVVDGVPAGTWIVQVTSSDGRSWAGTAATDGFHDTTVTLD